MMVLPGPPLGTRVARRTHTPGEASSMDIQSARNLACHRAARSVWDRRGWRGATIEERVSPWLVSLAGAGLLAAGARQRSWRGARWMVGGAALVGCAAAGLCNPRDAAVR